MSELQQRLFHVIAEVVDDMPSSEVHDEQQLERDLGFDSFDRVSLLNAIEDEFSICFQPPQDRQLTSPETTVLELLQAVERLLSPKGQPA